MYYRTCPLYAVRDDLTASGFTVTTVPLTAAYAAGLPRIPVSVLRQVRPPRAWRTA